MTNDRYMSVVHTISRHIRAFHVLAQGCDSFFGDRVAAHSYVLSYEHDMLNPSIAFEPCL